MALLSNGSRRPIRNVDCHLKVDRDDKVRSAHWIGEVVERSPSEAAPDRDRNGPGIRPHEQIRIDLGKRKTPFMRAGERIVFVFDYAYREWKGIKYTTRFTDDAGQHWQIHPDLHLEKLDSRDDW